MCQFSHTSLVVNTSHACYRHCQSVWLTCLPSSSEHLGLQTATSLCVICCSLLTVVTYDNATLFAQNLTFTVWLLTFNATAYSPIRRCSWRYQGIHNCFIVSWTIYCILVYCCLLLLPIKLVFAKFVFSECCCFAADAQVSCMSTC